VTPTPSELRDGRHSGNPSYFVGASVAVGGAVVALPLLQGCGDDEPVASDITTTVRLRINGEDRNVATTPARNRLVDRASSTNATGARTL
jgi:hypothetical protein